MQLVLNQLVTIILHNKKLIKYVLVSLAKNRPIFSLNIDNTSLHTNVINFRSEVLNKLIIPKITIQLNRYHIKK